MNTTISFFGDFLFACQNLGDTQSPSQMFNDYSTQLMLADAHLNTGMPANQALEVILDFGFIRSELTADAC